MQTTKAKIRERRKNFHLVSNVENWVIRHLDVGEDQMQNATSAINLDMEAVICKGKSQQNEVNAKL